MLKDDPLRESLREGAGQRKRKERKRREREEDQSEEVKKRRRRRGEEKTVEEGGKDRREEGRAPAVKLHFILTDLLYTLISLLKKRKWHSIRRNPFLPEQACQLRDEWIQAELSSSGELPLAHSGSHSPLYL